MSEATPVAIDAHGELCSALAAVLADVTGMPAAELDPTRSFVELGADSLALLQFSQEVQQRFGVKLPFRKLLDEITSLEALTRHVRPLLPARAAPAPPPVVAPPAPAAAAVPAPSAAREAFVAPPASDLVERVLVQQLALMTQQLELLRTGNVAASPAPPPVAPPAPAPDRPPVSAAAPPARGREVFVAYQPIQRAAADALEARQREHLEALIARLTAKTAGSKQLAAGHRAHWADSTNSAKFRRLWKELCYPIVAARGAGAHMWDVDGNRYVDIAMGFGSLLFGHSPAFINDAIREQLERGAQVGPQSPLPGEVARLISELTGAERVAFCNSGTEAIMTALRLARTVTGRDKIAVFSGSFHGTFDGVLVRAPGGADPGLQAVPMAPGVPAHMVDHVLILPYNSLESVARLEPHAHELAAVLVEPFQSRRPDEEPRAFVHALRELTHASGAALVFDEIIVGFRTHPGGAQALLGVEADLVTYGKAVGAGMPIGVVAGRSRYLDAVDGGTWSFGDDSVPEAETTYFAGTFFKHPLSMAAARAALRHLQAAGPGLQEELGRRTTRLVARLNEWSEREGVPLRAVNTSSLFRFTGEGERAVPDLFYFHLLDLGVYVPETRVFYLSTAHDDDDIEHVIRAYQQAALAMRDGGFFPPPSGGGGPRPDDGRTLELTEGQKGLLAVSRLSEETSRAYNEPVALRLRGALDVEALRRALVALVARHDALRTTFEPGGETQRIHARFDVDLEVDDFTALTGEAQEEALRSSMEGHIRRVFDLEHGPLVRLALARLGALEHALLVVIHHLVIDGWSLGVVLDDLRRLYEAECEGRPHGLTPAVPFAAYALGRAAERDERQLAESESYWLAEFAGPAPALELPTDRPRPPLQSYDGDALEAALDAQLTRDLRALGAAHGTTLFVTLLAGFSATLHLLTGRDDLVLGFHSAGQVMQGETEAVGFCIEMLPLRSRLTPETTFSEHLARTKARVAGAERHRHYPLARLVQRLKLRRDPARPPLVAAIFNMDRWTPPVRWGGLEVEVAPTPVCFARFDLLWNVVETPGGLELGATYNRELFDGSSVRGWVGRFEALLQAVARAPRQRASELQTLLAEAAAHAAQHDEQARKRARSGALSRLKGRRAVGARP